MRWRVKPGRVLILPGGRRLIAGEEIDDADVPADQGHDGLEPVAPAEVPGATHRAILGTTSKRNLRQED